MTASRKTSPRMSILVLAMGLVLLGTNAVRTVASPPQGEDWTAPDAAKKVKNPVPANPTTVAAGKVVYTNNCARCHGDGGKGDGPDADLYDPGPANFTDGSLMRGMPDGELFYKITEGRPPMPSFKKDLSETQRWQAVDYVRTFVKK
jgi:mono/diheme cytochrome c family protein